MEIAIDMDPHSRSHPGAHLDGHSGVDSRRQGHIIGLDAHQQRCALGDSERGLGGKDITANCCCILHLLIPPRNRGLSNVRSLVSGLNIHPPVVDSDLLVGILGMECEHNIRVHESRVRGHERACCSVIRCSDIQLVDAHVLDTVLRDLGLEDYPNDERCQAQEKYQQDEEDARRNKASLTAPSASVFVVARIDRFDGRSPYFCRWGPAWTDISWCCVRFQRLIVGMETVACCCGPLCCCRAHRLRNLWVVIGRVHPFSSSRHGDVF